MNNAERTPVHVLIVLPTSPISDFLFQSAKKALRAAFSKRSSPVRRLKVANSIMREPAPAVPWTTVQHGLIETRNPIRTGFDRFASRHSMTEVDLEMLDELSNTDGQYILAHSSVRNSSGGFEGW